MICFLPSLRPRAFSSCPPTYVSSTSTLPSIGWFPLLAIALITFCLNSQQVFCLSSSFLLSSVLLIRFCSWRHSRRCRRPLKGGTCNGGTVCRTSGTPVGYIWCTAGHTSQCLGNTCRDRTFCT